MVTIKKAYIASYNEIIEGAYQTTLIIDETSTKYIIGVLNEDQTKIADINTGEVFSILDSTEKGKRIPPEGEGIELNVSYALRLEDLKLENYNFLEKYALDLKAIRAYFLSFNKDQEIKKTK